MEDVEPIHLALPKGHMQENVFRLFEEAGLKVRYTFAINRRRKVACIGMPKAADLTRSAHVVAGGCQVPHGRSNFHVVSRRCKSGTLEVTDQRSRCQRTMLSC